MIKKLTPMLWFVVLLVVTVVLALALPPDRHILAQLHVSAAAYRFAILLLLLPYVLIWYAVFYAWARLIRYNRFLREAKEGAAFRHITKGMGVLAFGLIVPTMVSLILGAIAAGHTGFKPAATIIDNYLSLLVAAVAFTYMNSGSHLLVATTRLHSKIWIIRLNAILFIMLGAWYTYLVLHNRHVHNLYHLALPLLILTFIIPYLYAWFVGLLCVVELRLYARQVKGLLYRQALRQFSAGLAVGIIGSIAVQFVSNTITSRISNSLDALVLIDYGLLIIVAVGLVMAAFGTKKLQKIEEV